MNGYHSISYSDGIRWHLGKMIDFNRIESFKSLIPRINFNLFLINHRHICLTRLLNEAIRQEKTDFCDFILSQDFAIDYNEFKPWSSNKIPLPLEDLKKLVARHPERMKSLAADWFDISACVCVDTAVAMIELSTYCASISADCLRLGNHLPGALMSGLITYSRFGDKEMAAIFSRLYQLGVPISEEHYQLFTTHHPDYEQASETIRQILDFYECVKEPEMD